MTKKLFLSLFVALLAVGALFATPRERKDTKSDVWASKLMSPTPKTTVADAQQKRKTLVNPVRQQQIGQPKNATAWQKSTNVAVDTITITRLPFHSTGILYDNRVYRLTVPTDTVISVSLYNETLGFTQYGFEFSKGIIFGNELPVTVSLQAGTYIFRPGGIGQYPYTLDIFAGSVINNVNPPVFEEIKAPYSIKNANVADKEDTILVKAEGLNYYIKAIPYKWTPAKDTTINIFASNMSIIGKMNAKLYYQGALSLPYSGVAPDTCYFLAQATGKTYSLKITEGELTPKDVFEYQDVTLPYLNTTGVFTNYSDYFQTYYVAYRFTLPNDTVLGLQAVSQDYDQYIYLWNDTSSIQRPLVDGWNDSYPYYTDTLKAGVYYATLFNETKGQPFTYTFRALPAKLEDVNIDSLTNDFFDKQQLTVGKTAYGTVTILKDPFITTSNWDGYGTGYAVHLEAGVNYNITFTTQVPFEHYDEAALCLFADPFTKYDDAIAEENRYNNDDTKTVTSEMTFVPDSTDTYYLLVRDWISVSSANYSLVVNEVPRPAMYTEYTLPFATDTTFIVSKATEVVVPIMGGNIYPAYGYYVTVPQDTLLMMSYKDTGFYPYLIISTSPSLDPSSIVLTLPLGNMRGEAFSFSTILNVAAGKYYLTLLSNHTDGDYHLAFDYVNKELSDTTVIRLDSLLRTTNETLLPKIDSLTFGCKPTRLVKGKTGLFGKTGKNYHAEAYKLTLDSADLVALQYTKSDTKLYVYQVDKTPTDISDIQFVQDFSNSGECLLFEADTTASYFFVATSSEVGAIYSDVIDIKAVNPLAVMPYDTLIAHAVEITLPFIVRDSFGSSATPLVDNVGGYPLCYAQAYKLHLDSLETIKVTETMTTEKPYCVLQDTVGFDDGFSGSYYLVAPRSGEYYIVPSTYNSQTTGNFTLTVERFNGGITVEEMLNKHAVELTKSSDEINGTLSEENPLVKGDSTLFEQNNNFFYSAAYKIDLKAGDILQTNLYFDGHVTSLYVYGYDMDGKCTKIQSGEFQFAPDTTGTYYIMFGAYANAPYTSSYHLAYRKIIPVEELLSDYAPTIRLNYISSEDTLQNTTAPLVKGVTGQFGTNNSAFYAKAYRFYLKQNQTIQVKLNASAGMRTYIYKENETNVPVVDTLNSSYNYTPTKGGYYYLVVSTKNATANALYMLQLLGTEAITIDELLDKATLLTNQDLPFVYAEQNAVSNKLVKGESARFEQTGYSFCTQAYKIDLVKGSCLKIKAGSNNFPIGGWIYNKINGKYVLALSSNSSSVDITYTASATATYYLAFNPRIPATSMPPIPVTYSIELSDPYQVIEVTGLVLDTNVVNVRDIEEDIPVRMALGEINISSVVSQGVAPVIINNSGSWVISEDRTQAEYEVTLPSPYVYAKGVDSVVTVLINPATITASCSNNGTVSPEGVTILRRGTNFNYTITADENFVVDSIYVDKEPIASTLINTIGGVYNFTNVTEDHTLHVVFRMVVGVVNTNATQDAIIFGRPDRTVKILGAVANTDISIYTVTGILVYNGRMNSTAATYSLPQAGVYVVRLGNQVAKVVVK
jgi:hypothetical protein